MKFCIRTFFLTLLFLFFFKISVLADECAKNCQVLENEDEFVQCVQDKQECYKKKIEETKEQKNTLANAIGLLNNQMKYQESQIEFIRVDIIRKKKEVDALEERIKNLDDSLKRLTSTLINKIRDTYKKAKKTAVTFSFFRNFQQIYTKKKFTMIAQQQTSKLMFKAMDQKLNYDEQKQEKEEKQKQLEARNQQLKKEQQKLQDQKQQKNVLLQQTKNDEATYQRLLKEAEAEVKSFLNYAEAQSSSSCLASAPGQKDGWFFSQRDPQWCKQYIGRSRETVGDVGCLISSVAMIWKKHGHNTSPSRIAANSNYFFSSTAFMLSPPPVPPGFSSKLYYYYSSAIIDKELSNDRPVIVHVKTNNGYGGHFIVLKSGSNGNYIMNDPWHGESLSFNSKYSTGIISKFRIFTK